MGLITTVDEIEYPESDGKPMGETDLHRDWMVRILELFRHRFRGERIYLASDLLLYYEEGEPISFVVPDVFVVKDSDPGRRRVFKTWEEGKVPSVVVEVTSRSSRRIDEVFKPQIYARIGIPEYFLYDPTSDYLDPALQGYRLAEGGYTRIQPGELGRLSCQQLDIHLCLEDANLAMYDGATGQLLLTEAEAAQAARVAAEQRAARAEARAAALEAELRQLRQQYPTGPDQA